MKPLDHCALIGAAEDELRQLVQQLEARRKNINPENTMSASALQGEARSVNHRACEARLDETTTKF